MIRVEDLHGVEALRREAGDQSLGIVIPDGVSERAHPSGAVHGRDDLVGRPPLVRHVPRMLFPQKPVERFVVRGRITRADQGARDVRPSPDAVPDVRADRVEIDRKSRLEEPVRHPLPPVPAGRLSLTEDRVEGDVLLVHEESQDVDVALPCEVRGNLGARDELDASPPRFFARFGQALQRVVVGQREGADSSFGHAAGELGRCIEPIGDARMAVEVNPQAARSYAPGSSSTPNAILTFALYSTIRPF